LANKLLAVIEKAGTKEAVPFLEERINGPAQLSQKLKPEEVKRTLAKLLEREELLSKQSLLLRPSEVAEEHSELLLRPAANSQPTDDDQLLRAAAKDP
jgi:hypothetical protein